MADYSKITNAGKFALQFSRMAAQLHCAMPGVIESFNPETQRCTVTPGIKLKVVLDGEASYLDLPIIQDVPIMVPYGQKAGLLLTFPINPGDPCLLVFADRAIDNFLQTGQTAPPPITESENTSTPRAHALSDAICIPGMIADVNVVPQWNQDNIEMRDKERKHFISLGPDGIELSDSEASIKIANGEISIDGPAGIKNNSAATITDTAATITSTATGVNSVIGSNISLGGEDNTISGGLTSTSGTFTDANGINSSGHVHGGVQSGSSDTGAAKA